MADTTAPAPNPNVELLTAIFPTSRERPAPGARRDGVRGARELLAPGERLARAPGRRQQAAAAAAGGHGAGADDDDDDDDDGDGDGGGDDGAAPSRPRSASARRSRPSRRALARAGAVVARAAFDELEARAAEAAQAQAHAGPRYGGARAPAAAAPSSRRVVVLSSGAARLRVGEFLGALFPTKCPSTSAASSPRRRRPAGRSTRRQRPPADAVLQPEWHEKHADFRVKKTVDAPPAKPPGGLFAAHAQKRQVRDRAAHGRPPSSGALDAK
ncbi:hypothetical protein JL721_6661 [Aureococcus anophagefferens]|nr:hypothetical protein JL721_6661 [Aureococcus anophagefferens]